MKKFYWLPKLTQINILQYEPEYNPCFTTTQKYFWKGWKHYCWLWFKDIKFKFKGFNIEMGTMTFDKVPPKDVEINISYFANV